MAYRRQVLLLAVVAAVACLASPASAEQWKVGDDKGWRPKFNETGWANNKTFVVGDSLMFMYTPGKHTVAKVGKEAFATCDLNATLQLGNWTSGNDVVPLDKPGKVWFICTVPTHCTNGMKLVLDVQEAAAGAPAAPPSSAPPSSAPPSSAPVSYTVGSAVAVAGALLAAVLAF